MIEESFAGDLRRLAWQSAGLAAGERHGRDLTLAELEAALAEVTVRLTVYRTYTRGLEVALYQYNRLLSLNEVGGDPGGQGVTPAKFHHFNQARRRQWPHTLNATSTHDSKRSEDVRARLNVLAEIPQAWEERLTRWHQWNRPLRFRLSGHQVPDTNTEFFLYQTLVGAWPLAEEEVHDFKERLGKYLVKAAREAKEFTSWLDPKPGYEEGLAEFATAILEPGRGRPGGSRPAPG
ncbi:MAG: hypothetical protein D9V47_14485 [Clostridia bacterium]|nr:MAG: hypothetical protein D9V47_14485 [Clostridia bacterium]